MGGRVGFGSTGTGGCIGDGGSKGWGSKGSGTSGGIGGIGLGFDNCGVVMVSELSGITRSRFESAAIEIIAIRSFKSALGRSQ